MTSHRFDRLGYLLAPLLLAALVASFGALSFERKVAAFQPTGLEVQQRAGHWVVTAVASTTLGLEAGDQVLLVDGVEASASLDLASRLRAKATSELAVLRGDRVVELEYQRPGLRVDLPYLILALIGVAYLLIGLYTVFMDRRRQSLLFFLWCLTSTAFYLLSPILPPADLADKLIYLGDEVARILLGPLTLHLFLVFPTSLSARRWLRKALPFLYLPAALLLALQLDLVLAGGRFLFGRPTPHALRLLDRLEILSLALFVILSLVVLWRRLASRRDLAERRQVRWIAVGVTGGYAPLFLLYVLPWAVGAHVPVLLQSAAVLPLAVVPLTFAYAILRYKLWDIDLIVRDTISYTLTLLLGVIGFSLVNLAVGRSVAPQFVVARNLIFSLAGLSIAGLLLPAKRSISSTLERLQYRGSFGKRRALSDFGRELLHERDLDRLCSSLIERLGQGMALDQVNLYLVRGKTLVLFKPQAALPVQLPIDGLGRDLWRVEVESISAVALPTGASSPAQRLFAAGYRYAFPLVVRGHAVGLTITSYKQEQTPLNSEDIDLVRQLLNQVSLALENAQLLDELHDRLGEVLRLQQYNEGIIESSPAGIAVLDPADRLVSANLAFAALAGVERRALAGRPLAEVLPVEPLPLPGEGLLEVSFCDALGEERHLQLSTASFAAKAGERHRILMVHDVSERVRMENQLKEKDRLAALGMLAAGVAHEVNTPITGISSYAQMLLADMPEEDPRRELLKKVERQTFRASRIVNSLLEFARHRENEQHPVAMGPLLAESIELLRERIADRGIELTCQAPPEEVLVQGSDGELQQVFTNLLLNSIDALAPSGGEIRVALEADAARVVVTVEDDGPGIPAEQIEKIFQPFFSTKLATGGTGLGLSISYDIVRRHGGDLRVASDPGEGCRFIVELPRKGA